MPLEVDVVSQVQQLYHTERADMVIIPGREGEMGVLPHHAPLLTTLNFGELRIVEGDNIVSFVVYGGVVEVRPDKVIVLADAAESALELDEARIKAARERAEQLMAEATTSEERAAGAQELRRAEIAAKIWTRMEHRPAQQIKTVDQNGEIELH